MRHVATPLLFALLLVAGPTLAAQGEGYRYYPDYESGMLSFERGDMRIALGARMAIHAAMYTGDNTLLTNGDLLEGPGFRLRRTRITLGGQFIEGVRFGVGVELFDQEKSDGPLLEAFVDVTPWAFLGATVGLIKTPFSYSQLQSSGALPHLDRGFVIRALTPDRQLGLVLRSQPWGDRLTIEAGVFNGMQRARFPYQGYEGIGISMGNRFGGASFMGRLEFEPLGDLGRETADVAHSRRPRVGLGGGFLYDTGGSIHTMIWSAYLHAKWMGAHVLAEYVGDQAKPDKEPTTTSRITTTIERMGVTGEVGYMILPELLGLALRVEWLDLNRALEDEHDSLALTATATVYAVRNLLKFQLEYTHRMELHGVKVANDSVLAGLQLTF
jgi:hypothetical protein